MMLDPLDRIEQYLRVADSAWSTSRKDAVLATPDQVVQAVRTVGTVIAEQYFLGTAKHESNWATNERDMEPADHRGLRFTSWGLYQLSDEEAKTVGRPRAKLLDLQESTWILAKLAEIRRVAIRGALKLEAMAPDPDGMEAYLAIAHNLGLSSCITSLRKHGLDWPGYKSRNPTLRIVSSGYGEDCLPRRL